MIERKNKRFGYFLCMFVCEGWGLGFGWGLEAPAHPSATILWPCVTCFFFINYKWLQGKGKNLKYFILWYRVVSKTYCSDSKQHLLMGKRLTGKKSTKVDTESIPFLGTTMIRLTWSILWRNKLWHLCSKPFDFPPFPGGNSRIYRPGCNVKKREQLLEQLL